MRHYLHDKGCDKKYTMHQSCCLLRIILYHTQKENDKETWHKKTKMICNASEGAKANDNNKNSVKVSLNVILSMRRRITISNVEYRSSINTIKQQKYKMKEELPSISVISPSTIKDITILFYEVNKISHNSFCSLIHLTC